MYGIETVAQLLPGVWDRNIVLDEPDPYAPDPEMPRAAKDPRRLNDKWVMLADVQRAWRKAPLTMQERRVLYCTSLLLESDQSTARLVNTTYERVVQHREEGLHKLLDYLNGY